MKYIFHPEAEEEFFAAIDYYEKCQTGLGFDFSIEVHSAIENILSFPKVWPILEGNFRRCQPRRFPYGVIYAQDNDAVLIFAIMHLHRDPDYWKEPK